MTDDNVQSLLKEADKIFSLDNLPADINYQPGGKVYLPLPDDTYQVQVEKVTLKENPFYREPTDEDWKNGTVQNKYQFNFQYQILGDFQSRKIWDTTGIYIKPSTKQGKGGPTKLYMLVTKIMGTDMNWDDCRAFAPDIKTLYKNLLEVCENKQIRLTTSTIKKENGKYKTKVVSYMSLKLDKNGEPIELAIPVKEVKE